jgi:hypothetical protein
LEKLNPNYDFTVDEKLVREESRIARLQEKLMATRRGTTELQHDLHS